MNPTEQAATPPFAGEKLCAFTAATSKKSEENHSLPNAEKARGSKLGFGFCSAEVFGADQRTKKWELQILTMTKEEDEEDSGKVPTKGI